MQYSKDILFTIINPNLIINESVNSPKNTSIILEEIQLYENFLTSMKQYLQSRYDDTISDVTQNLINAKDSGVLIKEIITNPDYLEKVLEQLNKQVRNLIKSIRSMGNVLSANNALSSISEKIRNLINSLTEKITQSLRMPGWKGFLYSLGLYCFARFILNKFTEYKDSATEMMTFFTSSAPEKLNQKILELSQMILNISGTTMTEFMSFFSDMAEISKIFVSILAYVKRKLEFGKELNLQNAPVVNVTEDAVGRIVKGVNTTADVGPNEIKKQAAKFGNKVTKDGEPPLLNTKITKNTTTNKLYNLGLTETIRKEGNNYIIYSKNGEKKLGTYKTKKEAEKRLQQIEYFKHKSESYNSFELAIMEGGHTLEEDWKTNLKRLVAAGALTAVAAGGLSTKSAYDKWVNNHKNIPVVSQIEKPSSQIYHTSVQQKTDNDTNINSKKLDKNDKTTSLRPKPRPDNLITTTTDDSELAPKTSIRPIARPDFNITFDPKERLLIDVLQKTGIKGIEMAAFLSQAAHETGNYAYFGELGNADYFNKYDPQYAPKKAKELGNTEYGDGYKYRGRGYLHLTGRANYKKAGDALGLPLVDDPDLAANPRIAAYIAVWYWNKRVKPRVDNFKDVKQVTVPINPSLAGLQDRETKFKEYIKVMSRSNNLTTESITENTKSVKLKDLAEIKTNFENADFWISRRNSINNVGMPSKEYNPESIGIKVVRTDVLLPSYLYYVIQYLHSTGYFKKIAKGVTNLVNITTNDVRNISLALNESQIINIKKIIEAEIVDLDKKREDKKIGDFHKSFMNDVKSAAQEKMEAYKIANEEGLFDDLPVGSRFTLPKGASYKVLSHSMTTHKTNVLPNHQQEFRNKHNFGPAKFIEYNGKYFKPMIYAEEVAGEMAGSNSGFELDKLINFETGEKRYKKFTGPKRVTEKKKQNTVKEEWYHGTADVREIRKEGGFQSRNINVTYISDPKKWKELQHKANKLRDTNKDEYFKILDELSALKKNMTTKSPIFLTNVYNVAKTYADPHRAWDYQGAEERILRVSSEDGKNLKIDATGKDFKGINIDNVTKGLVNAGISLEKIQNALEMFSLRIKNGKLSTDALAVIAQMFGFDTVDVTGVLDSYNVGKIRSTVRMVFNPSTIKIIAGLNENMSVTGTETAKLAKEKGILPGTDEWFEHWFSLPYMIDQRNKKHKPRGMGVKPS